MSAPRIGERARRRAGAGGKPCGSAHGKVLPALLSATLMAYCAPALAGICAPAHAAKWRNPEKTLTESTETYSKGTITRDSDGFFAALSSDGKGTFSSKIGLSDLEKIGISFDKGEKVAKGGKGSYKSPAKSGSTNGANFSYDTLYTITVDSSVFEKAAQLSYVNNNGVTVSYNKRDTIQAVLYAIGKTTQAADFDGKTMYQVNVDYDGTIDLTNGIFVYSNTWLKLGTNTVMKKQFQSEAVASALADREDAQNRRIDWTNENLLRCGAGELSGYAYSQCKDIIIEGGTWDANLAQYNREKLGDKYQSSLATFAHAKNLVVQNARLVGANLAHHLELSGVRDVTVSGCEFSQDDGAYANEAIQLETLHSRGSTRECAPYDDTVTRDVVIYDNVFEDLSRGVGNHAAVLGRDTSRVLVRQNTFRDISSQAVLACGCRTMRIEKNTMEGVGNGVDIRMTWEDGPLNFSTPHDEGWTYDELVADGLLNRNIKVTDNAITVKSFPEVDAVESTGTGVFVKGQTLEAADMGTLQKAAGSYTLSGIALKGNTVSSAIGEGIFLEQTSGISISKNKVSGVAASGTRAKGIYAENSSELSIAGNTLDGVQGQGICLTGTSAGASLAKNKVAVTTKDVAIYAAKTATVQEAAGNRLTVSGPYAMNLAGQKTTAVTVKKKSAAKVTGTSAASTKLKAYVGKKAVGSAKTDAKGKFTLKFAKKQARGTAVELRYADAAKNSIRFDFSI